MSSENTPDEKLSPVLENYLEIIFHEENTQGAARTGNIADKAKVARSTVTSTLKTLQKLGYIHYAPYSLIRLTEKGKEIGSKIAHRHIVLKTLFFEILQLDEDRADIVACNVEHVLDDEAFDRLRKFVFYMRNTPENWQNWQKEYLIFPHKQRKNL